MNVGSCHKYNHANIGENYCEFTRFWCSQMRPGIHELFLQNSNCYEINSKEEKFDKNPSGDLN